MKTKPAVTKKPAAKKPAAKKPAPKKPAPKKPPTPKERQDAAREVTQLTKALAKAAADLKETQRSLRGVKKLQVKYARQLLAISAGLKMMAAKEKALVKSVAAIKKTRAEKQRLAPHKAAPKK